MMRYVAAIAVMAVLLLFSVGKISAGNSADSILVTGRDTIKYRYTPYEFPDSAVMAAAIDSVSAKKKPNFIRRIINYFAESSVDKSFDKKIDFSFVLGPSYSAETNFSLGVLAAGLYRIDKTNRDLPASDISIYATASVIGFYKVGVEGNNIFKDNQDRLSYQVSFQSQPTYFWGLGYEAAMTNERTKYISNKYQFEVKYLHRMFRNTYAGVLLNFDYAYSGKRLGKPAYIGDYKSHYSATGLSLILEYDSRDFIPNPYKGVYVSVQGMIRPKAFGSAGSTTWTVKAIADYYQKLWKGGVLALDLYGEFNSAGTPWTFYAQMGGSQRMRGYYEGRFSDLNVIMVQAELRQRIWRRIGMTFWGGAGNIFHGFSAFDWGHTMPNYGVGLRWEFKNRVNVRFDYGMGGKVQGKLINGFLVSVNEAF